MNICFLSYEKAFGKIIIYNEGGFLIFFYYYY